jgi:hypothetical protein
VARPTDLGRCRHLGGSASGTTAVRLPRGGAVLRAGGSGSTAVAVRRFASDYTVSVGELAAGRYYALKVPTDAAPDPWSMQLDPSTPLTLCPR